MTARVDKKLLLEALATVSIGREPADLQVFENIDSTNSKAATLAEAGAATGTVVLARQQTQGRGRRGNTWVSPPDSGIYMSVILRPNKKISELAVLSLAAGVAVAKSIKDELNLDVGLKWVNDIVYDGRKLGGILIEAPPKAVIVGIGLNLDFSSQVLDPELSTRLCWLDQLAGKKIDANKLITSLLMQMERQYQIVMDANTSDLISHWKSFNVTLGKSVRAISGNKELQGIALDLDESGALLVQDAFGQIHTLHSGEVSLRLADGTYA